MFSSHLFRGTKSQARNHIKQIFKKQGYCSISFVYFAQAMKFGIYQDEKQPGENEKQPGEKKEISGRYKKALQNNDLVCIDGIAMQIFDRVGQFFFGGDKRIRTENLNGTDFLPYVLEKTQNNTIGIIMSSVYDPTISKGPEWMQKGLQKMKENYPHIDIIASYQELFQNRGENFPFQDLEQKIQIKAKKYDYIFFLNGIGAPIQEIRTDTHLSFFKQHKLIVFNNGATIDYYSGFEKRAPQRIVKIRIGETLRRVITQPKKNLHKLMSMFRILSYRGYLIKNIIKKT